VRLTLHYDSLEFGAPQTVVAKFASDHEPSRRVMLEFDGYAREVRFYRELAQKGLVPAPKAYLAHYDSASGDFFLLLEDLAPAASPDRGVGFSLTQVKLVLDQIGALHARFWGKTEGLEWLLPRPDFGRWASARYLEALPTFLAAFRPEACAIGAVAAYLGHLFASGMPVDSLHKGPLTLTHSDLHTDNVFLPTEKGGRFALIDWQSLALSARSVRDVARLFAGGLPVELRRAHEIELLRYYLDALRRGGVEPSDFDALRLAYYQEMLTIVVLWVIVFDNFDMTHVRDAPDHQVRRDRMEAALLDASRELKLPFAAHR
jgi:hypothetical protein